MSKLTGIAIRDLARKIIKENQGGIRLRAQRFAPDMFYVNELAERLKSNDSETFEKLFR
jgi:hypothetical protein